MEKQAREFPACFFGVFYLFLLFVFNRIMIPAGIQLFNRIAVNGADDKTDDSAADQCYHAQIGIQSRDVIGHQFKDADQR